MSRSSLVIVLLLAVLIIGGGAALGVIARQQNTIDDLERTLAALENFNMARELERTLTMACAIEGLDTVEGCETWAREQVNAREDNVRACVGLWMNGASREYADFIRCVRA